MNTITIPKNLIKNDDLVIIPRQKYEKFLEKLPKSVQVKANEKEKIFRTDPLLVQIRLILSISAHSRDL